jgi:hypothetical protein
MDINERDLIRMRKDVERIRKHEEARRGRQAGEELAQPPPPPTEETKVARPPSIPIGIRLREMLEMLWVSTSVSKESLEAIPEHVVVLLQVIREEPKFKRWFSAIEGLPLALRNEQLQRMSSAFRIEDGESDIARSFDRLHDSSLFKAFCQALRDEKTTS